MSPQLISEYCRQVGTPNRQPPHRQSWWLGVQAIAVSSREAVSVLWRCQARVSLQNSHIHIEHRIQGTKSSYRPLGSSRRYERTCQKDAGNTEERPHLHAHHVGVCSTRRRSNLSADLLFSFFLLCRPQITSHSLTGCNDKTNSKNGPLVRRGGAIYRPAGGSFWNSCRAAAQRAGASWRAQAPVGSWLLHYSPH